MSETDTYQQRADALQEKLNQGYPESWRPQPGETLVGIFQRLERGYTSYGHAWLAVLKSPRNGQERSIWLLHTALRNQFKRAAPEPGELVAVRYEGKTTSSNGVEYDKWVVRVDRDEKAADWSQVPGDSEAEAPQPPAEPAAKPGSESWDEFAAVNAEDQIPF